MAHLPHVLLISQSLTNQPVAIFCFLSSTFYPSYQQQWITNYQTLFIMSKCVYTLHCTLGQRNAPKAVTRWHQVQATVFIHLVFIKQCYLSVNQSHLNKEARANSVLGESILHFIADRSTIICPSQ